MNQNTTEFVRCCYLRVFRKSHTHPEATVTIVLLIYYSSFLNAYCK